MLHQPAESSGSDPTAGYKARVGVWLCVIYACIYAGFVIINLVSPNLMETPVLLGLNLAVTYGMGLIILAFILALIYSRLCSNKESRVGTCDGE